MSVYFDVAAAYQLSHWKVDSHCVQFRIQILIRIETFERKRSVLPPNSNCRAPYAHQTTITHSFYRIPMRLSSKCSKCVEFIMICFMEQRKHI